MSQYRGLHGNNGFDLSALSVATFVDERTLAVEAGSSQQWV